MMAHFPVSAFGRSGLFDSAMGVCPCGLGLAGAWALVGFLPSCWLEDWERLWSEPGEFSQVLGGGGEQELVLRATRTP